MLTSVSVSKTVVRVAKVLWDGRVAPIVDVEDTVDATWVEKCTDVDGDGQRTGYLVYLREWSRKRGTERDDSVQGTHLAVTGAGSDRKWSLLKHIKEPTAEARSWLDEHFGAHSMSDEQWLRGVLPEKEVEVGESWTPDPGYHRRHI